jgi:hypothetical protein
MATAGAETRSGASGRPFWGMGAAREVSGFYPLRP